MPNIFDNTKGQELVKALRQSLESAYRADFCVGYFNLRGWRCIADTIDKLPQSRGDSSGLPPCRLIIGMTMDDNRRVRDLYADLNKKITQAEVARQKKKLAQSLRKQLTYGCPTSADEKGLCHLAQQLREGTLQVKFFGAGPMHAKLYLAHREDQVRVIGYVGSSNLTLAGMAKQGELNVDVTDSDATAKLVKWFEEQWNHKWCIDISEELANIITKQSWAGGPVKPYEIYIKTAYELSKEAIEGSAEFKVPKIFHNVLAEFQEHAVSLAAERMYKNRGVIISDVVGLGKTFVACAIAKTFQESYGGNMLVICPPKIEGNWKGMISTYEIAGDAFSLGKTKWLSEKKRYRLIVIDESHNLRNRKAARHKHVRQYIEDNDPYVILLTATPYNKEFTDIASQLRLFVDPESDLGIRPDDAIRSMGGETDFSAEHPHTLISSLSAFECSSHVDDWRELMRMYMVRRTRGHIKKNYAEYDTKKRRHYFLLGKGKRRQYFPNRISKCAKFGMNKNDRADQYAILYSSHVVDIISQLSLPRYGLAEYLDENVSADELSKRDREVIDNLSRAGRRLIGFARSGLFKRLESSAPAFLLSIRRHIVRNTIYLAAFATEEGEIPVGSVLGDFIDEFDQQDLDIFDEHPPGEDLNHFMDMGRKTWNKLSESSELRKKFEWISTACFNDKELIGDLTKDCHALLKILKLVPQWNPGADRKLSELANLCLKTHGKDKLLIFTQFKDTATYLYEQLRERGLQQSAIVSGDADNANELIEKFSPRSHEQPITPENQLRVLITTDTLSEGHNLQDAHIIVNFDLPWAIIRLVQRAGRVDRIGQESKDVYCYCFLPEDGVEEIINLRGRLRKRMEQNAELVGSDEKFFEGDAVNLKQVYEETLNLDQGEDDETDLISRAYDIYRQAIKDNPKLERRIKKLPDVVYSAKHSTREGALAYIKTSQHHHVLAHIDESEQVVSQSQSKVLNLLACEPQEPTAQQPDNHHQLVAAAVRHVRNSELKLGGQLGGAHSVRKKVYDKLQSHHQQSTEQDYARESLAETIQLIYNYPLKDKARDQLGYHLRLGAPPKELAIMACTFMEAGQLCTIPKENEPIEPHIICSMGLATEVKP